MNLREEIKRLVRKGADASAAAVLRKLLEDRVARYGLLRDLRWDSLEKTAALEVLLKGESTPATLWIEKYELVAEEDRTYLIVREAKASREWVELLLSDFLVGKRLEIPAKYGRLARALL